jgi:undecaprenyl pyrophosphate synthase
MHIAIIMDGNGRWATRRHLPRTAGHRAGAKAVNDIVEAAARRDVRTLSLYAFSAANWDRPKSEVSALLRLLQRYLLTQTRRCLEQSIRINVIGRRDRLSPTLRRAIEHSERATAQCKRMCLRIAVDYSAQYSLMEAARRSLAGDTRAPEHPAPHERSPRASALHDGRSSRDSASRDSASRDCTARDSVSRDSTPRDSESRDCTSRDSTSRDGTSRDRAQFIATLAAVDHSVDGPPEVDLLIRTGGEQRLSDFLLFECAYAELYFAQTLWPDFNAAALDAALADYSRRERRFGQISAAPARAGLG